MIIVHVMPWYMKSQTYQENYLPRYQKLLGHDVYIITSDNIASDLLPALIWGFSAFIVGLAAGTFLIKKRYLLPLIGAHALNNIISATALWLYGIKSIPFKNIAIYLYAPMLICSFILLIVFRKKVKYALSKFFRIPKFYSEESDKKGLRTLLFDIGLGLMIFFLSFLFF